MVKGKVHAPARVGRLLCQLGAVRCVQRAHRLPGCIVPDNRQVNRGFAQIVRHRCAHGVVKNMVLRTVQQVHISENTAHAQLVLIFQIAAVAPLHHQYRQPVASSMDKGTDIKRAGRVRNLTVSHQIAIDPDVKTRIHALKVQFSHVVRGIQCKIGHIRTAGVVFGDVRRVERERIADVGILMPVISEHLPAARHRDSIPAVGVKVGFFECIGHVPLVRIVGKAPSTAEQGHTRRACTILTACALLVRKGDEIRVIFYRPDVQHGWILIICGQVHRYASILRKFFYLGSGFIVPW